MSTPPTPSRWNNDRNLAQNGFPVITTHFLAWQYRTQNGVLPPMPNLRQLFELTGLPFALNSVPMYPPGFPQPMPFNPTNAATNPIFHPHCDHLVAPNSYIPPQLGTNRYSGPNHSVLPPRAAWESTQESTERRRLSQVHLEGASNIDPTPLHSTSTNFRQWEQVGECREQNSDSANTFIFNFLSYNVLAQKLLEAHLKTYNYCNLEDLQWEARCRCILTEVTTLDPDVICLQEVQHDHFKYFDEHFGKSAYKGIYKRKTNFKADGCAIFYKESKFELQDSVLVEFYRPTIDILKHDNVGIVVKLAPLASPKTPVVIANTHLLYTPNKTPTRLAQMRILLSEIQKLSFQDEENCHLPIILTGDFNSQPDTIVTRLLDDGQICIPVAESLASIGLEETLLVKHQDEGPNTIELPSVFKLVTHPFQLSSVYESDKKQNTTFVKRQVVDYIYFSHERLKVLERLVRPYTRRQIPNKIFGSDHVSIAAIFELNLEPSDLKTDHCCLDEISLLGENSDTTIQNT